MNRRTFFSKVAAVAAVPVVVPLAAKLQAQALTLPPPTAMDGQIVQVITPEGKMRAVRCGPQPDLLQLRHARGLMKPCPNCIVAEWRHGYSDIVQCARCGWLEHEATLAVPCPCDDCEARHGRYRSYEAQEVVQSVPWGALTRDAPAGRLYRVVDDFGPVTRFQRNVYDLTTDGYLHNVTERQIARVSCAIRVAQERPQTYAPGHERSYQPNGNVVIVGWETVDCHEWQQDAFTKACALEQIRFGGRR